MKSEKAVTMLILVLTVIILLILAGVTISYVVGDDGAVAQSSNASFIAEIEQIMDQLEEKETLYILEEVKLNSDSTLTDAEKQSILSSRYNIYDQNKSTMDIESVEKDGEIKLILKYKGSKFNDAQIKILNEYGAKDIEKDED